MAVQLAESSLCRRGQSFGTRELHMFQAQVGAGAGGMHRPIVCAACRHQSHSLTPATHGRFLQQVSSIKRPALWLPEQSQQQQQQKQGQSSSLSGKIPVISRPIATVVSRPQNHAPAAVRQLSPICCWYFLEDMCVLGIDLGGLKRHKPDLLFTSLGPSLFSAAGHLALHVSWSAYSSKYMVDLPCSSQQYILMVDCLRLACSPGYDSGIWFGHTLCK